MGIIFFLFLGVIVAVVAWLIATYNGLVKMRNRVKEAWSDIDVQLKRRYDLIPNLINTVKGYASHEKEVFQKVTEARSNAMQAEKSGNAAESAQAENMLSGALKSLFAVAEAYPELKAQEGFVNLQKELSDTEDKVAYSRQFYNSVVRQFNEKIVIFPSNIVAGIFGFKAEEFFEAEEGEREASGERLADR